MPKPSRAHASLPTGTVTFLFTDIEGSTRLWEVEPERMPRALARHDALAREAVANSRGVVVKMVGDGVYAAFGDALDAVNAALAIQLAIADVGTTHGIDLRVRCGLHAGPAQLRDKDYFGSTSNRAARIMAAAHGGQILLSQVVAIAVMHRLPDSVTLRDLGFVRLRDLDSPERVHQVLHPQLRQEFPALRSLEATPNNLPQLVTSFIGRERELAEATVLLKKSRLLTLVGAGGLGKTRLSLQIAADTLDDFPDGVWLVDLAPLTDERLIAQTLATVLGVKGDQGRSLAEGLAKHVRDRQLLVILDNCEHLVQGCAELTTQLLHAGPGLKVLASSREHLRVPGEMIYQVPALGVPDAHRPADFAELMRYAAVRLFIERAVAVRPTFQITVGNAPAVVDICQQLDGIPLAIELAAARVPALSVETIAQRLSDRFRLLTHGDRTALPRQRTLRAMVDWSYELLTDAEQLLFARLSAFAGGWTIVAAEAVGADAAIAREDVMYLLIALIEKSLVVADEDGHRYRMLETIRQYAGEKLAAAADADAVRMRHRDFYLALAEKADQKLRGREQTEWLARLTQEHDNLRAAHERCLAATWIHAGLRLCWTLRQFWWTRGHLSEGREWCARMLAQAGDAATSERADALNAAGALAYLQSDYDAARVLHEESLAIRRALGDRRGVATSLSNLGAVACDHGEFASAIPQFEESLAILRELNDPWGISIALGNLGRAANEQGDFASARARIEESLAIKRTLGDRAGIARSLGGLANVAHGQGDHAAARALHTESLAIHRELGNRTPLATELINLGSVAFDQGEYALARESYVEALRMLRELGDRRNICGSLEGIASLAAEEGRSLDASRLFGASERLREEIDAPLAVVGKKRHERVIAAARAGAGDEAKFRNAWQEGRGLTLEQAVELALATTAA